MFQSSLCFSLTEMPVEDLALDLADILLERLDLLLFEIEAVVVVAAVDRTAPRHVDKITSNELINVG